jgi:hypothetical protein
MASELASITAEVSPYLVDPETNAFVGGGSYRVVRRILSGWVEQDALDAVGRLIGVLGKWDEARFGRTDLPEGAADAEAQASLHLIRFLTGFQIARNHLGSPAAFLDIEPLAVEVDVFEAADDFLRGRVQEVFREYTDSSVDCLGVPHARAVQYLTLVDAEDLEGHLTVLGGHLLRAPARFERTNASGHLVCTVRSLLRSRLAKPSARRRFSGQVLGALTALVGTPPNRPLVSAELVPLDRAVSLSRMLLYHVDLHMPHLEPEGAILERSLVRAAVDALLAPFPLDRPSPPWSSLNYQLRRNLEGIPRTAFLGADALEELKRLDPLVAWLPAQE